MNTDRMASLMQYANEVLEESGILDARKQTIEDAFNGQTAAFGVSIAMSGLLPALAMYYQQASDSRVIDRRKILCAVGKMIFRDEPSWEITDAESLLRKAMAANPGQAKWLKQEVIGCAIALKQVIRTYKLV